MTTIDRRDLVRGAFATSLLAVAGTAVIVPSQAQAAPPLVTRGAAITRAQFWMSRDVPYSQSATYPGPAGQARYRTDCSGFVSMCLMLPAPGPNTTALAGSTWTNAISRANLRAGDMLVDGGNHVVLFHKWANAAHTQFWLYEQSSPSSDMNHRIASLSSFGSAFKAKRAKNIRD